MSQKENLFIYGSLKYPPHISLLGDATFVSAASVIGKLYLVDGQYPGFVEGRGIVLGQIYEIPTEQFRFIDEYEGELYMRRKILTSSHRECWIYQYLWNQ